MSTRKSYALIYFVLHVFNLKLDVHNRRTLCHSSESHWKFDFSNVTRRFLLHYYFTFESCLIRNVRVYRHRRHQYVSLSCCRLLFRSIVYDFIGRYIVENALFRLQWIYRGMPGTHIIGIIGSRCTQHLIYPILPKKKKNRNVTKK